MFSRICFWNHAASHGQRRSKCECYEVPFILFGSCEKFKNCRISCYQHITYTARLTLSHTHVAGRVLKHAQLGCLSSGLGLSWFSSLGFVTVSCRVARALRVYKFKNLFVFTWPCRGLAEVTPCLGSRSGSWGWGWDWELGTVALSSGIGMAPCYLTCIVITLRAVLVTFKEIVLCPLNPLSTCPSLHAEVSWHCL